MAVVGCGLAGSRLGRLPRWVPASVACGLVAWTGLLYALGDRPGGLPWYFRGAAGLVGAP